ncbi:putative ribosomal protein L22/L17 [Helianthus annuus]|nr:putative ribosomal protein L22/L17 [Helianthus annuus]
MPYRACYPIFKLVYSAAANASSNMGSNEANLVISKAKVNIGTIIKRLKPRARGRSFAIQKPTCHITIVMKDISLDEYIDTYSIAYMTVLFGAPLKKSRPAKNWAPTEMVWFNCWCSDLYWVPATDELSE